jgi:hypothetical protein
MALVSSSRKLAMQETPFFLLVHLVFMLVTGRTGMVTKPMVSRKNSRLSQKAHRSSEKYLKKKDV